MEIVIALVCVFSFVYIWALLYRMERIRHKAYIAKEEEQIALYRKISHKLDEM